MDVTSRTGKSRHPAGSDYGRVSFVPLDVRFMEHNTI